jgi:hypothetical protein
MSLITLIRYINPTMIIPDIMKSPTGRIIEYDIRIIITKRKRAPNL